MNAWEKLNEWRTLADTASEDIQAGLSTLAGESGALEHLRAARDRLAKAIAILENREGERE